MTTIIKMSSLFGLGIFLTTSLSSQVTTSYNWQDPSESIAKFEGQGWEHIAYNRLPERAKDLIRPQVWELSHDSAGLGVRFETDADSIAVMYEVDGALAMNHMAATGVSGVDLYVKDKADWLWCRGRSHFNDTIRYDFIIDAFDDGMREHQLLFPLYNNIKNIKIGVPKGKSFLFMKSRTERPVVIYGTSIAQGACASRPGMAWTNILSRKLDLPVINLGFSGNGRLEPELIALINEIDAAIFVLDCLPNLSPNETNTKEEIQRRIRQSVLSLRKNHPQTPILLVQHAGYSDGQVDRKRAAVFNTLNEWMTETFGQLRNDGIENLQMLTKESIHLANDAFVDGTHPTDLGMLQYAEAYEKVLREMLIKE